MSDVITGPVAGPRGPHHRRADDASRCVCGEPWVQSMTCHPCRVAGHRAAWCVDGPGELVHGSGGRLERVYPARSAGRWCNCQHDAPPAGRPVRTVGELAEALASGAGFVRGLSAPPSVRVSEAMRAAGARVAETMRLAGELRGPAAGPAIEGLYALGPPRQV